MAHRPCPQRKTSGNVVDLLDYKTKPVRAARPAKPRPAKQTKKEWRPIVTDDFPDEIPITDAELDIFEVHFADLLDELFGPRR